MDCRNPLLDYRFRRLWIHRTEISTNRDVYCAISPNVVKQSPAKPVTAKAHTRRARTGVAVEHESASPALTDVADEKAAILLGQQDHLSGAPSEAAGRSSEVSDGKQGAFTSATPEAVLPFSPASRPSARWRRSKNWESASRAWRAPRPVR